MQYTVDGGASWARLDAVSVGADHRRVVPSTPTAAALVRVIQVHGDEGGNVITDVLVHRDAPFSIVARVAANEMTWGTG
jgi:hypothetical protein